MIRDGMNRDQYGQSRVIIVGTIWQVGRKLVAGEGRKGGRTYKGYRLLTCASFELRDSINSVTSYSGKRSIF